MIRWLAVLVLGGCAADAPTAPEPRSYRTNAVPVASVALHDPADISGVWRMVDRLPGPRESDCATTQIAVQARGTGDATFVHSCKTTDGPGWVTRPVAMVYRGQGRYAAVGENALEMNELWVIWRDTSGRTSVFADPDGRFLWVLNRGGEISADRRQAAREILKFNGYDAAQLQEVSQR